MPLMVKVTRRVKKTVPGAFGPKEIETTETERVPLEPRKHWSMYTAAGNRRLRKIAEDAMKAVEAVQADKAEVKKVLIRFLTRWELLTYSDKFGEAGDTAVREVVGSFHDKLAVASGHWDDWDLEALWEKNRDAAYVKARDQHRRRQAKKQGSLTKEGGAPSRS